MTKSAFYLAALVLALAASPSALTAQACAGNHASHGSGFAGAFASFTEGATGYGVSGGGVTNGPLFVAGSYKRIDADNSDLATNSLGVTVGAELTGLDFSLCPAFAFTYSWFANVPFGVDLDEIDLAGGFLIGKSFGEDLLFTPHASAAVVHARVSASLGSESETTSDTGGIFAGGFRLGSDRFYGGPGVSVTTFGGSDPVFSLSAGVVF